MTLIRPLLVVVTAGLTAFAVMAQNESADSTESSPPVSQTNPEAQTAVQPTAEQVRDELLKARRQTPLVDPVDQPVDEQQGAPELAPAATADVDATILGFAPGERPPSPRREGEFIINRRGRVMRVKAGGHMLFVFDADARRSPETPVVLLPCGYLEYMEDVVRLRGENVVFILSGQITLYRGINYVLPTMVRLAEDQGNLEP